MHGGRRLTLDLFDGRLTVLTGPAGDGWRTAAAELAVAGVPIAVLTARRGNWLIRRAMFASPVRAGPRRCVLVRPDGYVGWMSGADSAPSDLTSAILAVTGRVRDPVELVA